MSLSLNRPGRLVALILAGELAAFLVLFATGTLERFGPALVALIMSANLLIVALAVWTLLRKKKP